ncbi:22126_t:CDS:2, partial [Cetraspora pellucida]
TTMIDSNFFFNNLSNLEILRLYDMEDVSFNDIILLKNLKFLVSAYINIYDMYFQIYTSFNQRCENNLIVNIKNYEHQDALKIFNSWIEHLKSLS